MAQPILVTLTADIVASHVANNVVAIGDVPTLIESVFNALADARNGPSARKEPVQPVVSIRASVKPDRITCLLCGEKRQALTQHLRQVHHLEPRDYRAMFELPADYPLAAPDYVRRCRELATQVQARRRGAKRKTGRSGGG